MDTEQLTQRRPDAQIAASRSFDVQARVGELAAICSQRTRLADYPSASGVASNVLV